jgi:hypothetical protein
VSPSARRTTACLLACPVLLAVSLTVPPRTVAAQARQDRTPARAVGGTVLDSATIAGSPARTLADLLSGRVPGLNVTYTTGAPGFAPEITARGSASRYGPGRPLLYVDGVLMREDPHQLGLGEALDRQVPAPAWSLPTSEIAQVEVLLGPAAGTLLAFGAPRGAVMVRTRRGGGAWRSTGSVEAVVQSAPAPFSSRLLNRGLVIGGGTTDFCPLTDQATGYCVQTSSYTARPFGGATPFRSAAAMRADVSATGDTPFGALRVGAAFDQAPAVLARDAVERIDLSLAARSRAWRGLSVTVDARVARHAGAYVRRGAGGVGELGTNLVQPADTTFGAAFRTVDSTIARATPYRSERESAALDVRWTPRDGVLLYAQGSATRTARHNDLTVALYSAFAPFAYGGTERTFNAYLETLGAGTAGVRYTRTLWRTLRASVEIGGHRTNVDQHEERRRTQESNVGSATLDARTASPDIRSSAFFTSARLELGPARWISGGFRKETTTLFGRAYGDDPFNALQVAWTASEERFFPHLPGIDRVHLRAAYGESGDHEAVLAVGSAFAFAPDVYMGPARRLQRTLEREAGADLDLFGRRVQLRATAFSRALRDGYLPSGLPSGSGGPPLVLVSWETHGHEWSLVRAARGTGPFRWDGALHWSSARTRIMPLNRPTLQSALQGGSIVRFAPGEWFGAVEAARHYFTDANADGIIDATEITIGAPSNVGVTQPRDLVGATFTASWRRWLQAGVTLDGKFGHVRADGTARYACQVLVCDGLYGGTLAEQARAVASGYSGTYTGPVHAADFVRARELWVRVAIASRFVPRALGGAALTLAVRNVGSWSRYPSGDPEVGSFAFPTVQRGDYFTPALPRLVSLRLDLVP